MFTTTMIDVDRTIADKPTATTTSTKTATSKTHSNKTSKSRVSFQLISPDKPAACTPPRSPDPVDAHDDPDESQDHASAVRPSIHIAPSKRDTLPNNSGNNRNSNIRVNTLFCRVPDNDSVISDLSASIIPTGSQLGRVNDRQRFTGHDGVLGKGGGKEISLFSSILNACGTFENMPEFLTNSSIIGTDTAECGHPSNVAKKTKMVESEFRRPTMWGVAPSHDDDDDEDDEDENELEFKAGESTDANTRLEHEEEEFDNVELVLDENMMAPPPKPPKQERPPLPNNGRVTPTSILRKKVSKVSGALMNRAQSPKLPNVMPNRSPSPSTALGNDPRISHTYDIAVFENEELRPSGFRGPATTTLRCVTPTNADSVGGNDEEEGELVAIVDDQEDNKGTSERKEPVEKEEIKPPEPRVEQTKTLRDKRNKSTRKFSVVKGLSFSRKKSGKVESPRKNKAQSSPEEISANLSPTQSSAKSAESKSSSVKPNLNPSRKTTEDPKSAPSPKRNRLSGLANSLRPASIVNSSPDVTSTATATANTSEDKTPNPDAKNWKATLDKTTNKTYYYHTKTKEVTWEKPPGFDELQKKRNALVAEAKHWKATLDPSTGKTYYYHSKTKEVTWVKPDGFKESKKEKTKNKGSEEEKSKSNSTLMDVVEGKAFPVVDNLTDVNTNCVPDSEDERDILDDVDGELNSYEITNGENRSSNVIISVEEDAPFDEPVPFDEPGPTPSPRTRRSSPQSTSYTPSESQDDLAIPSESLCMAPITNRAHSDKSYEFSTRQRTFASQMTDTTKKIKNTKPKDFDDAQVNVDVNTSLDSSIASEVNTPMEEASASGGTGSQGLRRQAVHDYHLIMDSRTNSSNKSGFAPSHDSSKPTEVVSKNPNNATEEDEPTADDTYEDYDDWSDEVSELSGIGNDSDGMLDINSGRKKLLIGRRNPSIRDGHQRDSRTEKSSPRDARHDDVRNWTQEELDSFISKNDWGSVSKYIAEMRDNKQKHGSSRRQPSIEEIQAQMEYNRRQENDGKPKKKFGAKSQIQHSAIEEEESSAESLWNSLSSTSYKSSNEESSFADPPRRSTRQKHPARRTKMV